MAPDGLLLGVLGLVCLLIGGSFAEAAEDGAAAGGESDDGCLCSCLSPVVPASIEEKKQLAEEGAKKIKKELIVPTKNLTATVRKKESALDERPSAQSVGYLGVVMLCLSGVIIIVMDANYIVEIIDFIRKTVCTKKKY